MTRPRGGFIGYTPQPAASAENSAAGGIWTLREAEELKRAGTWPMPPFLPSSVSGLQGWWDPSDASTITESGGVVSQVDDKSGNDYHLTQATAASRPSLISAAQNGLSVLRLDGSDDFMAADGLTSSISDLSGSITFFAVCERDTTGTRTDQVFTLFGPAEGSDTNSDGLQFYYSTSNVLNAQSRQYNAGFTDKFCQSNANTTAPALLTFRGLAASSWRVNGSDVTAAGTTTDITFSSGVSLSLATLGARRRGDTPDVGQYFDGDICEIIIYNAALSDTDRDAVENYLLAKWGIS